MELVPSLSDEEAVAYIQKAKSGTEQEFSNIVHTLFDRADLSGRRKSNRTM